MVGWRRASIAAVLIGVVGVPPAGAAPVRVFLLRSAASAAHFERLPGAVAGAYDAKIARWRERLVGAGFSPEPIDDAGLAKGVGGRGVVVVAPAARCAR